MIQTRTIETFRQHFLGYGKIAPSSHPPQAPLVKGSNFQYQQWCMQITFKGSRFVPRKALAGNRKEGSGKKEVPREGKEYLKILKTFAEKMEF